MDDYSDVVKVSSDIQTPDTFPFPFPPYDIQHQFMTALFNALNEGKLGIFESPTGTGKSLSLICGSISWFLEYHKKRKIKLEALMKDDQIEDNDDDWLAAAAHRQKHNHNRYLAKQELNLIEKREEKIKKILERRKSLNIQEEEKNIDEFNQLFKEVEWMKKSLDRGDDGGEDDEFLIDDYVSDEEQAQSDPYPGEQEDEEEDNRLKIIFCSRTHSQLTQFVREVKKSPFANEVSLVSLASRNVMCINPTVKKLKSQAAINEKCLELGKKKSKSTKLDGDEKPIKKSKTGGCGCPYNKSAGIENLRDDAILGIHDIEDLVISGKKSEACPYYASRSAVKLCEMVVLPYNSLLHAPTRKAIGLNLKNSVIIIDEAHNLLETIAGIHSVSVSGNQLAMAYSQLTQYKLKYKSRLKASNLLYIKQILFILASFIKFLGGTPGRDPSEASTIVKEETKMMNVSQFLVDTDVYNQNLLKLVKYCNASQIPHKLHAFSEMYKTTDTNVSNNQPATGVTAFLDKMKTKEVVKKKGLTRNAESEDAATVADENKKPGGGSSPLLGIVEFLNTLATNFADSKILVTQTKTLSDANIRFLLLDPASQFKEIVSLAHSVIVAGGTMQPVEEFKQQLFIGAGADESRIMNFSCDHVVPGDHILPLVLSQGPSGVKLDFSYQYRDTPAVLDELGRVLQNLVAVIPAGIVIFLPSYNYEDKVFNYLNKQSVIHKLSAKKTIFREPRGTGDSDKILAEYSRAIRLSKEGGAKTGAILLAVVGGKMSEGINFSDELGRCVIMVGMPYPNMNSPELKEKMSFLNAHVGSINGKPAGQVHYENLCMKAVNQSVGRAIRHRLDYATIVFLDHRYGRQSVQQQLPGWIRKHVKIVPKFGPVMADIRKFFKSKSE